MATKRQGRRSKRREARARSTAEMGMAGTSIGRVRKRRKAKRMVRTSRQKYWR